MVLKNKIVTTVIILLLLSVLFSGCTEEKNIATAPDLTQKEVVNVSSQNVTKSSKEENIPEISIVSFSSIYMSDNSDNVDTNKYDISERCYAVYDIIIKNNGSYPLYFNLNGLSLHEGDRIFNTTTLEPYDGSSLLGVLYDLENENKLQDTTLLPGQSLNGIVAFRVDSLYNNSFLLKYDTTTVTSASFEKSIEALTAAEYFNYSVALGIPAYSPCGESDGTKGSEERIFDNCDNWANWVNRSIFETFQKSETERMRKQEQMREPGGIPESEMAYSSRIFPEKNITMFPVTTQEFSSSLIVIDDTGEELINTSRIAGVAVLSDQTYTIFEPRWKLIMPRMNFSNAYVVRISFLGYNYGSGTVNINNQNIILDDKLNMIVVRNYPTHFYVD